jgi:acyl carrier protein
MNDALAAKVMAGIADIKRIPVESITAESTFEELKMDSLDAMNLLFVLEEEFGVSIPDEATHSIRDVRSAVAGVEQLLADKGASNAQKAGSSAA